MKLTPKVGNIRFWETHRRQPIKSPLRFYLCCLICVGYFRTVINPWKQRRSTWVLTSSSSSPGSRDGPTEQCNQAVFWGLSGDVSSAPFCWRSSMGAKWDNRWVPSVSSCPDSISRNRLSLSSGRAWRICVQDQYNSSCVHVQKDFTFLFTSRTISLLSMVTSKSVTPPSVKRTTKSLLHSSGLEAGTSEVEAWEDGSTARCFPCAFSLSMDVTNIY